MKEPSNRICEIANYGKSVFYKAICSCSDDKHTQTLVLDMDNDGVITLSIFSTIWTHYKYDWCDNWWERLGVWYRSQINKWKQVFTLIFTNQIEGENEFMLHGEEQIRSFIDALESGLNKIKQ